MKMGMNLLSVVCRPQVHKKIKNFFRNRLLMRRRVSKKRLGRTNHPLKKDDQESAVFGSRIAHAFFANYLLVKQRQPIGRHDFIEHLI